MSVPTWVIIFGSLAFFCAAIFITVRGKLRMDAEAAAWKSLPGFLKMRYIAVGEPVDEERLVFAVNSAIRALTTVWPEADVLISLSGLRILVTPQSAWDHAHLAGQAEIELHRVNIASGLKGLCHEFAHIIEWRLNGVVDYEHANWRANGIYTASDAYEATL